MYLIGKIGTNCRPHFYSTEPSIGRAYFKGTIIRGYVCRDTEYR